MGDTEFLRLAAEEAEFKRVKERLTLKHKNTSQWARRALRRGINVMDEGMPSWHLPCFQHAFYRYSCMCGHEGPAPWAAGYLYASCKECTCNILQ